MAKNKMINLFHSDKVFGDIAIEANSICDNPFNVISKNVYMLKQKLTDDKVLCMNIVKQKKECKDLIDMIFLTQNNKKVKVYDNKFNTGEFDILFKKDGYSIGDIYIIKTQENNSENYKVILVTDLYVLFFNSNNKLILYSFDELNNINIIKIN
ncbi:TPA: hypothetical protein UL242_002457 [Clostridioides difficile]|uniref:hypothetical protein n=1 Tax=Clostridioides difficile TaxID=1496 RepID=UPI000BB1B4F8|nr:hypothetical protein [Clostridioides difficile]MCW0772767.1 hypothetical protein [Clostridioides difficile]MCW0912254.1 hypothetical protein [Clostridioides difficile]MDI2978654.1 hypothetical protein [Clostridioides difficile]MDI6151655.1 hypothetical protein [Clostridioides difficile]MDI7828026.1 hypothetical protein [Clostridioides difficile]